jgi:hypothetical protein
MNKHSWIVVCTVAALMSACGGGNDSAPPAATDAVPAAASQSATGLIAWLTAMTKDSTEVKEGLDIAPLTAPVADDAEPEALK